MSGTIDHAEASADKAEDRAFAARVWCELTKSQREFLECAELWTGRDGCVGCGTRGGAQTQMAESMVVRGLLGDEGMCVHYDDHSKPERPTYSITPLGRLVLSIGAKTLSPTRE